MVESKCTLKHFMMYFHDMEREASAEVKAQGITGVDIMMITTEGHCTRQFGVVVSKIVNLAAKLWKGKVVIVHRTDTGVGEQPGSPLVRGQLRTPRIELVDRDTEVIEKDLETGLNISVLGVPSGHQKLLFSSPELVATVVCKCRLLKALSLV